MCQPMSCSKAPYSNPFAGRRVSAAPKRCLTPFLLASGFYEGDAAVEDLFEDVHFSPGGPDFQFGVAAGLQADADAALANDYLDFTDDAAVAAVQTVADAQEGGADLWHMNQIVGRAIGYFRLDTGVSIGFQ